MNNENLDLEVYVKDCDTSRIVNALEEKLGIISFDSKIDEGIGVYKAKDVTVVITEEVNGGYTSVCLRGVLDWATDIEVARFLSKTLNVVTRSDPGSEYPSVDSCSDVFVEIVNGNEKLIDWID